LWNNNDEIDSEATLTHARQAGRWTTRLGRARP
jgi:hypothetical protein